jgi:hypothetical protein
VSGWLKTEALRIPVSIAFTGAIVVLTPKVAVLAMATKGI